MKHSYSKEINRPVKEKGKVVGHNVVRLNYDDNDKLISEKIIKYVPKKTKGV